MITLPCKLSGKRIINPIHNFNDEFTDSREWNNKLRNEIIQQEHTYTSFENEIKNVDPRYKTSKWTKCLTQKPD